jgi:K+-transporting ATPase ATPase B chain
MSAAILTTLLRLQALRGQGEAPAGFILAVALWLWFTVLFANFAEALAEGRSKAQAASLRGLKKETWAKKLHSPARGRRMAHRARHDLRKGDVVLVRPAKPFPPTARSSKAWPRWTNRPSPANRRR